MGRPEDPPAQRNVIKHLLGQHERPSVVRDLEHVVALPFVDVAARLEHEDVAHCRVGPLDPR